jgi:hypothetical protein
MGKQCKESTGECRKIERGEPRVHARSSVSLAFIGEPRAHRRASRTPARLAYTGAPRVHRRASSSLAFIGEPRVHSRSSACSRVHPARLVFTGAPRVHRRPSRSPASLAFTGVPRVHRRASRSLAFTRVHRRPPRPPAARRRTRRVSTRRAHLLCQFKPWNPGSAARPGRGGVLCARAPDPRCPRFRGRSAWRAWDCRCRARARRDARR